MRVIVYAATAAVLAGSLVALADTAGAQSAATAPQPRSQPQPPLPINRSGAPVEGWAVVRYSVLKDGTTDEVRVIEAAPEGIDTRPTAQVVERWTFSPATENGEAVDWHNGEDVVVFRSDDDSPTTSRDFQARYDAIRTILESEPPIDFAAAMAMSDALVEQSATKLEQLGLALAQRTIIAFGMENWQEAYETIRLVTDPRVPALSSEDLLVGLQLRLQLADTLGRLYDAKETHDRFAAALQPNQQDPFTQMAQALDAKLAEDTLEVAGRIDEEPWRISADRRIFTIAGVEGSIDEVDVECDFRKTTLDFQEEVEWQLPASWGDCELFVVGEPGTTFRFFHFLTLASE